MSFLTNDGIRCTIPVIPMGSLNSFYLQYALVRSVIFSTVGPDLRRYCTSGLVSVSQELRTADMVVTHSIKCLQIDPPPKKY